MTPKDNDLADLSVAPTVGSLTALLGEELFKKLSAELGGRRLYVPTVAGEHGPISVVVGLEAATKISEIYAGMQFDVPVLAGRKKKIVDLRKAGESVYKIAAKLGITRTTVHNTLAEEAEKNQLKLFD